MGCAHRRGSVFPAGVPAPLLLPAGIVLVRYLGDVENGKLPALIQGGTRHRYGTARRQFYVDAAEVSRILAWRQNGKKEFEVANGSHTG